MNITLVNAELYTSGMDRLMSATLIKVAYVWPDRDVTIYLAKRKESGWLEFIAVGDFTLGCIQRGFEQSPEFHS